MDVSQLSLFILSPFEEHLGCFQFRMKLLVTFTYRFLCEYNFSFHLGYLRVRLLSGMVSVYLI